MPRYKSCKRFPRELLRAFSLREVPERLSQDPTLRHDRFGEDLGTRSGADLALAIDRNRLLTQEENLAGLAEINRALIAKAETIDSSLGVVLDMDSTEIPVCGQQEQSAYNGHFEFMCYHPLLVFNGEGD